MRDGRGIRGLALRAAVLLAAGAGLGHGVQLVAGTQVRAESSGGTVSLAAARQAFEEGRAVFVDARQGWLYEAGHIPGALSLSLAEAEAGEVGALEGVSVEAWMITYCDGAECSSSRRLAALLRERLGFARVDAFVSGWPAWRGAGYPARVGSNP